MSPRTYPLRNHGNISRCIHVGRVQVTGLRAAYDEWCKLDCSTNVSTGQLWGLSGAGTRYLQFGVDKSGLPPIVVESYTRGEYMTQSGATAGYDTVVRVRADSEESASVLSEQVSFSLCHMAFLLSMIFIFLHWSY